jgi:hypothetical protein
MPGEGGHRKGEIEEGGRRGREGGGGGRKGREEGEGGGGGRRAALVMVMAGSVPGTLTATQEGWTHPVHTHLWPWQ